MRAKRPVEFHRRGYTLHLSWVAIILAIFSILLTIFLSQQPKVKETYTERTLKTDTTTVFEAEYKKEIIRPIGVGDSNLYAGATLDIARAIQNASVASKNEKTEKKQAKKTNEIVKHFPESTYIKGAIMLTGEAGGIPSLTEQSGCLWIACNRVDSENPFFPDELEAVIEQKWQFDGYTPGGEYYEECYNLAVDVFERWYCEKQGEESVGRTLPTNYLFFTGDGVHNYFTIDQYGEPYVWGSELKSPYKN